MQTDFEKLFTDLIKLKVAVIGDLMLDTYWWGKVDRISPEAPVPIVALSKREQRIGGAGNVALNVRSMGASVSVLSVLGHDAEGEQLRTLLELEKIDTTYLTLSENRITTNKIRIMSRNQQMMRLDAEIVNDILQEDELKLIESVSAFITTETPDVIIFEDYNKGILTGNVIREVLALCRQNNIITTVDPKRRNFFAFTGVDIFKPNLKEVKDGLNIISEDTGIASLHEIHILLEEKLHHAISLITLSEKGIFFESAAESTIINSHLRNISDVSGAGDTVIAVASLVYAATNDVKLTAEVANIAGGLVCEEVGTAAIDKIKLLSECKRLLPEL